MPMYDFKCDKCSLVFEEIVPSTVKDVLCDCGGKAIRLISAPRVSLDGTDSTFPGAYSKWAKVREQRAKLAKKRSYHEE